MESKLSSPTKKLLQKPIAWILNSGSRISRKGLNLIVETINKEKKNIHAKQVSAIVLVAPHSLSPQAIELCTRLNVPILISNSNFRIHATITSVSSNSSKFFGQTQLSMNPALCLEFCKKIVLQKITNQKLLLKKYSYSSKGEAKLALSNIAEELSFIESKIAFGSSVESLRGLEGYSSKIYFSGFNYLAKDKTDSFTWQIRTRKPPKDNINATLSFSYFIGLNLVMLFLSSNGLDTSIGIMHAKKKSRPSLALDFMELLRPACDRICLTLINRKQLQSRHFEHRGNGIFINREGIKVITSAFNKRVENIIGMMADELQFYKLLCVQSIQ